MTQTERDLLSSYLKHFIDTNDVVTRWNAWFEGPPRVLVYVDPLGEGWPFATIRGVELCEDSFPDATKAVTEFELRLAEHKFLSKKN